MEAGGRGGNGMRSTGGLVKRKQGDSRKRETKAEVSTSKGEEVLNVPRNPKGETDGARQRRGDRGRE
jgi:hypothetical protein